MQLNIKHKMASILNLAILFESEEIFLWQYRILEKLFKSEYAQIKLFILKEGDSPNNTNSQHPLFYLFHEQLDSLLFKKLIDFNKKVNVVDLYKTIPVVNASKTDNTNRFLYSDISEIRSYNLDLILNFGIQSINDELAGFCKLGALTYLISKQIRNINSPSCYWEVINKMPEIEISIQLKKAINQENIEIFRTGILPYPNSININRNNAYALASLLVPRIIQRISSGENAYLSELMNKDLKTDSGNSSDHHDTHFPSSIKALSNLFHIFFSFLKKKLLYNKIGHWFLFFKLNNRNEFFPPDPRSLKVINSSRHKFWADPFVVSKDGFHYVFVEEYLFKSKKGHISVLKLDDNGNLLSCDIIIEKPFHMSYPHVFIHDGAYYMIPETGSNKTIQLYKCLDFPIKWVFVKNIMENIHAKDSTIFFFKNKWWLFVSIIENANASLSYNELFLYYAEDLLSSVWQSHPMNPIVSDHKLSRPAGTIYMHDGKIYRPSQDCSGIYGRALNINCITKLNETEYEEVLISKTEPLWDKKIKGIHTYNFNEKIIIMDAFSFRNRTI